MKRFFTVLLAITSCVTILLAAPFDTGYIIWHQPNGITFIARMWGDEFFSWFETQDGYKIYRAADGWYYYANLDNIGEYTASSLRVGIDKPLALSYKLERSANRIEQIKQRIYEFYHKYRDNPIFNKQSTNFKIAAVPETLKLGIILVEFPDKVHYRDTLPLPSRPDGYFEADFEKEFYSSNNEWFDTTQANGTPHPENEKIFGSMRYYWFQMSKGKFVLTGQVVNPMDPGTGVPEWIELDATWQYYHGLANGSDELALDAIYSALNIGYISNNPVDSNYYDKLLVIYAGDACENGALQDVALTIICWFHHV